MAELKIKADSGGGTVSLKGPSTTTSNAAVQLTLPVDDGTANTWLKSNGSGVTSWAAPTATEIATSSGTAGSGTFLRGDNTWAAAGGGKILQVVSTTSTATDSVSVATTAWGDLGPTRAITPSAATSKIWITAAYTMSTTATNMNIDTRLVADGSVVTAATGDAASNRKRATVMMQHEHSEDAANIVVNFLHSPNTTSEVTYKLQFGHNSSITRVITCNRCGSDSDDAKIGRYTSTLTCMEIGA